MKTKKSLTNGAVQYARQLLLHDTEVMSFIGADFIDINNDEDRKLFYSNLADITGLFVRLMPEMGRFFCSECGCFDDTTATHRAFGRNVCSVCYEKIEKVGANDLDKLKSMRNMMEKVRVACDSFFKLEGEDDDKRDASREIPEADGEASEG